MARAYKLPSGNWRVQVTINGERKSFTAPTRREAEIMSVIGKDENKAPSIKLGEAIKRYIDSKSSILSVSTIRGYKSVFNGSIDERTKRVRLDEVTNETLQKCLNECSINHSPKTVANAKGLLTATMKMFRPGFIPRLTLPQKSPSEIVIPSDEEISQIIQASRGYAIELPILLAAFGSLRASEICGLMPEDIHDDHISVRRAMLQDKDGVWRVQNRAKTAASYRDVYLPTYAMNLLHEANKRVRDGDTVIGFTPGTLRGYWLRLLHKLGMPNYHFHALRHWYATQLHGKVPERDIEASGGWSRGSSALTRVYEHSTRSGKMLASGIMEEAFATLSEK